jgi:hypothetical protein
MYMVNHKIGILIISTSNMRNWKSIKETYLYNIFIKTFLKTVNKNNEYIIYIGIDKNDKIFDNIENQKIIKRFSLAFPYVEFKFTTFNKNIKKGHVSKMWNIIFKIAYDENCDYFYQCGDDINFKTSGWVNDCIIALKKNNNVGLTGPINNNSRILTQSFVSRKHMEIFGYYFPEELINWGIDDWYNYVYKPNNYFPLKQHYSSNDGGKPRYEINDNVNFMSDYAKNVYNIRKMAYDIAQKSFLEKKIQKILKHSKNTT